MVGIFCWLLFFLGNHRFLVLRRWLRIDCRRRRNSRFLLNFWSWSRSCWRLKRCFFLWRRWFRFNLLFVLNHRLNCLFGLRHWSFFCCLLYFSWRFISRPFDISRSCTKISLPCHVIGIILWVPLTLQSSSWSLLLIFCINPDQTTLIFFFYFFWRQNILRSRSCNWSVSLLLSFFLGSVVIHDRSYTRIGRYNIVLSRGQSFFGSNSTISLLIEARICSLYWFCSLFLWTSLFFQTWEVVVPLNIPCGWFHEQIGT